MLLAWGPAALHNVRTSTATTPLDVLYPDAMEARKNRVRLDGQPPRPNILLITADDFPRAALHAYGLPRRYDVAPNLWSMYCRGCGGAAMAEAFTTSSLCTPSRVALLTGRYASENLLDSEPFTCCTQDLTKQPTLHRVLRGAGYYTGYTGKFHMVDPINPLSTLTMFGHQLPIACKGDDDVSYRQACVSALVQQLTGADEVAALYLNNEVIEQRYHHPEVEASNAIKFIGSAPAPFFLHMNPTLTHEPFDYRTEMSKNASLFRWGSKAFLDERNMSATHGEAMDEEWSQTRQDALNILKETLGLHEGNMRQKAWEEGLGWDKKISTEIASNHAWPSDIMWQSGLGSYSHMEVLVGAAWLDATLGRVFAEMRNRSGANTLTIFTSDHGNCRTGKGSPYGGGARVPLLVQWPMHAAPNSLLRMRHIDWLPTLASLAGAELPKGLSGVDRSAVLWPSAFGSSEISVKFASTSNEDEDAFQATHPLILENGYNRAVVRGQWKLILNLIPKSVREQAGQNATKEQAKVSDGCVSFFGDVVGMERWTYASPKLYPHYCQTRQLYDLTHDPAEQRNVYSKHPNVVHDLTQLLWDKGCSSAQASCRLLKHQMLAQPGVPYRGLERPWGVGAAGEAEAQL